MADGVLLFNKMDVFTYRLPAFQAFPAAHSLSRELHHLATLSVPRTVHTDSHDMEHLTAQTEALCLRSCFLHLCVRAKNLTLLRILLVDEIYMDLNLKLVWVPSVQSFPNATYVHTPRSPISSLIS